MKKVIICVVAIAAVLIGTFTFIVNSESTERTEITQIGYYDDSFTW